MTIITPPANLSGRQSGLAQGQERGPALSWLCGFVVFDPTMTQSDKDKPRTGSLQRCCLLKETGNDGANVTVASLDLTSFNLLHLTLPLSSLLLHYCSYLFILCRHLSLEKKAIILAVVVQVFCLMLKLMLILSLLTLYISTLSPQNSIKSRHYYEINEIDYTPRSLRNASFFVLEV